MVYQNTAIAIGQLWRQFVHMRKFKDAIKMPGQAQIYKLKQILHANEDSVFGKRYGFKKIRSIKEYQAAVPPSTYEDLYPYIEAAMRGEKAQLTVSTPLMFATTSGTTGRPKYIPITVAHLKDYAHAFQIHNYAMVQDYPRAATGRFLIFSSSEQEGITSSGIPYGAISGLLRKEQSQLVQKYFALPDFVSKVKDVEIKYYLMLRLGLVQNVTAILGCNPSSLLLLSDQMHEHAEALIADIFDGTLSKKYRPHKDIFSRLFPLLVGNRKRAMELSQILNCNNSLTPSKVWPNLGVISCWKGGPMSFYLERIPKTYGDVPIRDFGYMASEGRGSIPLSHEGAGGVLALTSHFFEFVPEDEINKDNPQYLAANELELQKRYYIYFTTAAGLYRYNINDLVEVAGFAERTPIIQFVQKGMGISSITGEKLTEEQVQVALCYAVRQLDLSAIEHFTFAVQMNYPPYYVCFVELKKDLPESVIEEFLRVFEQSLQLQNIEYKDKRASGRLGPPSWHVVANGTFTKLRQKRVMEGAPEAQVKIPLLSAATDFSEVLMAL